MSSSPAPTVPLANLTSSYPRIAVSADPSPAWETFRTHNDSFEVNYNNAPKEIWPGGGDYGCYSAITGAVSVPPEAANNVIGTIGEGPNTGVDISGLIINSGIMGLAVNESIKTVAVGVYGSGGVAVENSSAWASNFTLGNFKNRGLNPSQGFNGNFINSELDVNLKRPPNGWAGTNAYGTSTVLVADSQPDGGLICHHMSALDKSWKVGIGSDHGACDEVMRVGMAKRETEVGPNGSGSQTIRFISSPGGTDYRHGYIQTSPSGDLVIQPNFFNGGGQGAGVVVANSDFSQACTIHPARGVTGPKGTFNTLQVDANATITGNLRVDGGLNATSLQVNTNARVEGNIVAGNEVSAPSGRFTNMTFQGIAVQLSAPGSIPPTHKALIVAA